MRERYRVSERERERDRVSERVTFPNRSVPVLHQCTESVPFATAIRSDNQAEFTAAQNN